jgi:hypothetical protein
MKSIVFTAREGVSAQVDAWPRAPGPRKCPFAFFAILAEFYVALKAHFIRPKLLYVLLHGKIRKGKAILVSRPWRPTELWDVEAPTLSRQSGHRWWWGCQSYTPAALYPHEDSWYSFLLEAESLSWRWPEKAETCCKTIYKMYTQIAVTEPVISCSHTT